MLAGGGIDLRCVPRDPAGAQNPGVGRIGGSATGHRRGRQLGLRAGAVGRRREADTIYLRLSGDACKCRLAVDAKLRPRYRHGCAAAGRSLYCFGGLAPMGVARGLCH